MARLKGLRVTTGTSANINDGSVVVDGNVSASSANIMSSLSNPLIIENAYYEDSVKYNVKNNTKAHIGHTGYNSGTYFINNVANKSLCMPDFSNITYDGNSLLHFGNAGWMKLKDEDVTNGSGYQYCNNYIYGYEHYNGLELYHGQALNGQNNYPLRYNLENLPYHCERDIFIAHNVVQGGSWKLTFYPSSIADSPSFSYIPYEGAFTYNQSQKTLTFVPSITPGMCVHFHVVIDGNQYFIRCVGFKGFFYNN